MKDIRQIIATRLENVKREIEVRMSKLKRNASGRSVRSLSVEVTGTRGTLWGDKSFTVMERGRKGGKVPKGFVGIIRQWIIDKGIQVTPIQSKRPSFISPQERGLRSMSGAIAYSIMKRGTLLHRYGAFDDIFTSCINREMEELAVEISGIIEMEINKINQNS